LIGFVVVASVALMLRSSIGAVLLVLALFLPALVLQDFCRYALIVQRRSRDAALNDLVWLIVLIGAFAMARALHATATVALVCWALGALVGSVMGLLQLRCLPSSKLAQWVRSNSDLSWRYSGEFILLSGTAMLLTVGLAAFNGVRDAAGFRGVQVILGPLGVLFMGTTMQMTPILARRLHAGGDRFSGAVRRVSATLGSVAAVWGVTLLLVPTRLGEAMLGSSWAATRQLLPIWIAYYVAGGLVLGPAIGLRAKGAATVSLRVRVLVAPVALGLGLLGALIGGPRGASIGLLIGNLVAVPLWWRAFTMEASTVEPSVSTV